MIYRFDPHVHTWYSADASSSPEEVIAAARARGLHGLVLTDHNSCDAYRYCLKAGLAREEGTPVDGFLVVPGVEVSTAEGHLLCYGPLLDRRVGAPVREVVEEIHSTGGLAVPAHPYDGWRAGIREEVLDGLEIQTIEVFNAAVTSKRYNTKAEAYARQRGLSGTAGSDAHHASAVGTAVTALAMDSLSVAKFLRAISQGATLERKYLSRREGLKKHFGNWLRMLNRRPKPQV
jgi:predicted metal-dependent phosphoesterase TrpH